MTLAALQTRGASWITAIELWLEAERDQLPLWLPVALGSGISAWFVLPQRSEWIAFICLMLALAAAGLMIGWPRRLGRLAFWWGFAAALGCLLIWIKATLVAHDVLDRPSIANVRGEIVAIEDQPAKGKVRLLVATHQLGIPARLRVTSDPVALERGNIVAFKTRLSPPPDAALPGGYDFTRAAWFLQLGAVGQVLGKVTKEGSDKGKPGLRDRLTNHIRSQLAGSEGGIAAAFASGDRGAIALEDEDAMRASGLTHLLSVSGLHVTAVVAAAMFLLLRVLALSPLLALRWPLLAISAGGGALAGIGYTLLTGAEIPTIRSCIAALLVLLGVALGREAMTLRLVATGAITVLLFWPQALVGASFQLSFAAITSIVALHEIPSVRNFMLRRDETYIKRFARSIGGLLLTGIAVEVALAPIALFHFHKSGLFGALANLIAIPLTTFVIMPLEALALFLDIAGWGAPFWWLTGQALGLLLWLAHVVARAPGAVAMLPSMTPFVFGQLLGGGLWLLLWRAKIRRLGLLPVFSGAVLGISEPAPDILVAREGQHMVVRSDSGRPALLRERSGDFIRAALAERSGEAEVIATFDDWGAADCTRDWCVAEIERGGRRWRIGGTRSRHMLDWRALTKLCGRLDIIVSDRRLPPRCQPRWLKLDRAKLEETGGLAITLGDPPILLSTRHQPDDHPWVQIKAWPVRPVRAAGARQSGNRTRSSRLPKKPPSSPLPERTSNRTAPPK